MREYDAIVIGAGGGGMACAGKMAKEGLDVLLLEKHNIPGGATSSFRRGRFEFEVAIDFIIGIGTKDHQGPMYKVLDDLGVLDKFEYRLLDVLYRQTIPGVIDIALPTNREALEKVLKENFPEESDNIDKFFEIIYGLWQNHLDLTGNYYWDQVTPPCDRIDPEATPEKYPYYYKYAYMDVAKFMGSIFTNRVLANTLAGLSAFTASPDKCCVIDLAHWLYAIMEYQPATPLNYSMELTDAMMDKFAENGGEVLYNKKVVKILIEDGRAVGVQCADGSEYRAKTVVADFSPLLAFSDMVDRSAIPADVIAAMDESVRGKRFKDGVVTIYAALDCDISEFGVTDHMAFISNPKVSPRTLMFSVPGVGNPTYDIPGTTVCAIKTYDTQDTWLNVPPECYVEKKWEIGEEMLQIIESIYPGFRSHIEEIDMASLVTNNRFLSHPGGVGGGFMTNHRDNFLNPPDYDCIDGLKFVGLWGNHPGSVQATYGRGWAMGKQVAESLK